MRDIRLTRTQACRQQHPGLARRAIADDQSDSFKLASLLIAGALTSTLAAGAAHADGNCTLTVSASTVAVGQPFSYGVDVAPPGILPSPLPPWYPVLPFTIIFCGSKNGVDDLPNGENDGLITHYQHNDLTGYGNPGGIGGTYVRYALLFSSTGYFYCATNTVQVTLLDNQQPSVSCPAGNPIVRRRELRQAADAVQLALRDL